MNENLFFNSKGPFTVSEIFLEKKLDFKDKIFDLKTLAKASNLDLTFFDSIIYLKEAKITKAKFCITTDKLKVYLPKSCVPIVVKNVLFELCNITKKFYPEADIDYLDKNLKPSTEFSFEDIFFGTNVLLGKNCKIGKNTSIASNTIIESNVSIGENSIIGPNVIIKNSLIGNNVIVQSGCKIGLKGFGFIPLKNKNLKFPHIGKVIIEDNVELAANCTIDRGSIDDTIIGKNTYLDNQVHVAHNVKIGENCMIAAQVGFAGSSIIGNNVSIGGQAGISGHLRIGNNVKIGGGSGVVKDIPDNTTVMGYPAVTLKEFLRNKKT